MANSADPDQLASSQKPTDLDLHCLQRQGISGFSRTRFNKIFQHHPYLEKNGANFEKKKKKKLAYQLYHGKRALTLACWIKFSRQLF